MIASTLTRRTTVMARWSCSVGGSTSSSLLTARQHIPARLASRRLQSTAGGANSGPGMAGSALGYGRLAFKAATSTSSAVVLSLLSAGSVAWYAHLYGLPTLGQKAYAMTPMEEGLHPASFPWSHSGMFDTLDHGSIRRGYQVYREVCSQCHSLDRIAWRNLVGVSHTVDEVKAMAEENEYEDGPDENGESFQRPGKLADYFPRPYPNDEAARAGNAGALPPDLSLITKARHGGSDYVMSLITGYVDPPAGVEVREGLNYNPYFPGGALGMARVLYPGLVDYEDGTPSTTEQMAKDVVTFLTWAAEPEMDERKKMGLQTMIILTTMTALMVWIKRFKWAPIKTRKIVYNPPPS